MVTEAERLLKFEEGKPRDAWAPRVDENGEVLSRVQVVAIGDGEAEIIRVSVPGDPGVKQGEMVRVEGMTAQAWEMEGRDGKPQRGLLVSVAIGAVWVPATRRWLVRALRAARVLRAWWRAWTDCELPRVRAGRVSAIPAGELVRVKASRGSSLEALEQRAEELAVCLQAPGDPHRPRTDNAATGTVTLVCRDPLAGMVSVPWPHRDAEALSLWEPIPVGVDELGETVSISLRAQRAGGRRTRRGQERSAVVAGGDRGARSPGCGCGCWTGSWSSVGVGAVRATLRGLLDGGGDRAAQGAARGDGGALSRTAHRGAASYGAGGYKTSPDVTI